jgi:lipopolysaccharide transport system permease protein
MAATVGAPPPPARRNAEPDPAASRPVAEYVIEPARRGVGLIGIAELWRSRELLYFLVWRDLKVRYAQTILGVAWAVLQPLLTTLIFTIVFGRLARVPSDGIPYPVFALAALVPWTYVSTAYSAAGVSVLNNANLITKVYFPRLVVPLAPVGAASVDFAVGLMLLAIALVGYGLTPSPWALVVVPASIAVFAMTAAGVGCWVSALSVQYRDVKVLVPFATTMWLYVSPIVYPLSRVPARWQLVYSLNPLAGTLDGFRASLVGRPVAWGPWWMSVASALVVFVSGAAYFRRTERMFADIV